MASSTRNPTPAWYALEVRDGGVTVQSPTSIPSIYNLHIKEANAPRHLHPLEGVTDTVSRQARETWNGAFGLGKRGGHKSDDATTTNTLTCRQINFWCPHEWNGDKYLVFLTRRASHALLDANLVTVTRLPRYAATPALDAANGNFLLCNVPLDFVRQHYLDEIFDVNQPVVFVSHVTRYARDQALPLSVTRRTEQAREGIFHCGATRQGLPHASTEMRVVLFSCS